VMRLHRAAAILAALAACLVASGSAQAAFPGHNGLLAVQPLGGNGIILISPHGTHRQVICTDTVLCGRATAPRFSPDGRDIVFADGKSHRPAIVAADGTCMWCLLGTPLTSLTGSAPAFTPDGRSVTLTTNRALWQSALVPGQPRKLLAAKVSGAIWSATGELAYTRAGAIWLVVRGGTATRVAAGGSPAFAPGGQRLAFTRDGAIWVVKLPHGTPRRLAHGKAPAFSPDGRRVAFIGRGGRVYIVPQRGGHPVLVRGAKGRALDWQPLPTRRSATCATPAGETVIARTAQVVVTHDAATPSAPWYGCLLATGTRRALVSVPVVGGSSTALDALELAGRFAIVSTSGPAANGACRNTVARVDLAGLKGSQSLYTHACDANLQGIDFLGLDASGFATWRARERVASAQALVAVSCPSSSLCVAVDRKGNAASSSNPAAVAPAWSLAKVTFGFGELTCPSTSLCVGTNGGTVVTSTGPGSGSWSAPVTVDTAGITSISCRPTFCVGIDDAGNTVSSTAPTGPSTAWTTAPMSTPGFLPTSISCPNINLCVAVGPGGQAAYSNDPTATLPTWTAYLAEPAPATLLGVDCPSAGFCLATDSAGNVLKTATPTLAGSWTHTAIPGATRPLYQPVCDATVTLCAARDTAGNVVTSTNPTTATPSWAVSHVGNPLTGLACPAASLCVATDAVGTTYSSTAPTSGKAWTATPVDVPSCLPCIAEQLYVQDDRGRQAIDTALPGSGAVIGGVSLSGNAHAVTWTHDGIPAKPFALR
jgi:hypothetical protein